MENASPGLVVASAAVVLDGVWLSAAGDSSINYSNKDGMSLTWVGGWSDAVFLTATFRVF